MNNNNTIWKWLAGILAAILISLIALIYGQLRSGNVEAMEAAKMVASEFSKYQNERTEKDMQTALILQSIDSRLSRIEDTFGIKQKIK
jgi:hypothetical protein